MLKLLSLFLLSLLLPWTTTLSLKMQVDRKNSRMGQRSFQRAFNGKANDFVDDPNLDLKQKLIYESFQFVEDISLALPKLFAEEDEDALRISLVHPRSYCPEPVINSP